MTIEEARDICGKITSCAHTATWRSVHDWQLPAIPLAEMLEANRIVREAPNEKTEGGTRIDVVCDDRLVAALYTLKHYDPERTAIATDATRAVVVLSLATDGSTA